MRAELRADAAMLADDRDVQIIVKVDRADDARVDAFLAADAFLRREDDAAAGTRLERAGRARFRTGALIRAAVADDADEAAGESACGAHADGALKHTVFFFVDGSAGEHAGKAPEALVHAVCA